MPAYVIAEITVTNPQRYEEYKALAPEAIAAHGGRYLARGGETILLEGDPPPARVVVLEFADVAAALRFHNSTEYAAARTAREGAATMRSFTVAGFDGSNQTTRQME